MIGIKVRVMIPQMQTSSAIHCVSVYRYRWPCVIDGQGDALAAVTAPVCPVPLRGRGIGPGLRVVADRPVFREPLPRGELAAVTLASAVHAFTVSMSARIRFIRHFW